MVYLLVELFNYRQLTRLRGDILPGLRKRLEELYAGGRFRVARAHDGVSLIECGREEDFDAAGCSSLALRALEALRAQRAELFGFALVMATLPSEDSDRIEERLRDLAAAAEGQDDLWLTQGAAPVFSPYMAAEGSGELKRVTAARRPEPPRNEQARGQGFWRREALVQRLLDALSPRLSGEPEVAFLYGPAGVGKTALVMEAARRLGAGDQKAPVLRAYTIFRRRSVIHPFVNSIDAALLEEVPRHLCGPETAVWRETLPLLQALCGSDPDMESMFPDHLRSDFLLGYQLYISAFLRMTSSRLLPAFLVFDGVETYHPEARELVSRLINEFLPHHGFIPVITSAVSCVPPELSAFATAAFRVHPLGRREVRSFARFLYPGIEIPPEAVRELRRRTGGLFTPMAWFLRSLAAGGRIHGDGRHQWRQTPRDLEDLPPDAAAVSSVLARSLPKDSMRLLYALCVTSGLFARGAVVSFLARVGFEAQAAEAGIATLIAEGLVEEDDLLPNAPAVRRALEDMLGRDAETLRETIVSRLHTLWKAGAYPRTVLLFSLLARSGKTDLALEVLPQIIKRKIDEGDFGGARLFCDPSRLEFSAPLSSRQKEHLTAITEAGLLRACVREEAWGEAEKRFLALGRHQRAVPEGEPAGDSVLSRSLYCLARGDAPAALDELKSALITFQETGFARGERSAYRLLGLTMLGEGRTGEAIEYLTLAERMASEAGDALGAVRSAASLAVCRFLEGRYTQCLQGAEQAEAAARAGYQRELEMFLTFLKVRCLFQLGMYEECSKAALACLCLSTIYAESGNRGPGVGSTTVFSAWLARSTLYGGNAELAIRILEKLDQTREVMFFLVEAACLSGSLERAAAVVEKALALPVSHGFAPPEGNAWRDGFSCVEGRCFRFGRDEALLMRSIRAFTGCLLGMRGLVREAVRDLHQLIRGEDSPAGDPYFSVHAYYYSLVLPEFATEEGDDKTTILSKSLKSLQERASRIESPAQKSAFLGLNYWNRRIMDDARQRRLI